MIVPDTPLGPSDPFIAQMHHFVRAVAGGHLMEPNFHTAYEVERLMANASASAR
jgi:predicted dehydrogenase